MVTKDYYSLNEVSQILGKSKETLRRWDREGKFSAVREPISQYRIYKKDQVNTLLKQLSIDYEDTIDNSETDFELEIEYREVAEELGFEEYRVAKAPNNHPEFIEKHRQ